MFKQQQKTVNKIFHNLVFVLPKWKKEKSGDFQLLIDKIVVQDWNGSEEDIKQGKPLNQSSGACSISLPGSFTNTGSY